MGLLDDLKKQADMLKTQQSLQQNISGDRIKLVEEKMKQMFGYVGELLKQLAVLKPVNPMIYNIPGVGQLKNLGFGDFFIDYRRKRMDDNKEYFDTISFYIKWSSPEKLVIDHDMPAAVQRTREELQASKLKFEEEEKRNPKGFAVGAKFTVPFNVLMDVVIKANHDDGTLEMQAKNLFGLGVENFVIPAPEVDEAMLEDFAKTLIGQPGNVRRFRVAAQVPPMGQRPPAR